MVWRQVRGTYAMTPYSTHRARRHIAWAIMFALAALIAFNIGA